MTRGPLTGKLLADRFIMKDLLGSGGMGDVYLATHDVLGVDYAVKLLQPELLAEPSLAERFKREAYAASKLRHPGIVQIIDFGADQDGLVYLVMEYVAGPSLARLVADHAPGTVPLPRALGILAQVAAAVQSAHDAGVVHRDLKPENVCVGSGRGGEDVVKILDFGLAKLATTEGEAVLTAAGDVFGTPQYMSPEQTRGLPVDHRSDLYSLGAMAYELVCGRPPFVFDSVPLLFLAHQEERPAPPSVHLPVEATTLPSALEDVILQCLEKDPVARPLRASALQAVCQQVLADLQQAAQGRPRAVPADLGKVIRDPASGSDWTRLAGTFNPFQHGPTLRGAELVQHGASRRLLADPAYRQWYWGQAVKLAESLAQRLLSDGIGGEPLGALLAGIRAAEDRAVALETDLTIVGVRAQEAETAFQAEEARLRDAVVDARHAPGADAAAGDAAEQALSALYRTRQEGRDAEDAAYAAAAAALAEGQQTQAAVEAQLFGLLHQLRPEPCPYGLRREYEGVAAMLLTLS